MFFLLSSRTSAFFRLLTWQGGGFLVILHSKTTKRKRVKENGRKREKRTLFLCFHWQCLVRGRSALLVALFSSPSVLSCSLSPYLLAFFLSFSFSLCRFSFFFLCIFSFFFVLFCPALAHDKRNPVVIKSFFHSLSLSLILSLSLSLSFSVLKTKFTLQNCISFRFMASQGERERKWTWSACSALAFAIDNSLLADNLTRGFFIPPSLPSLALRFVNTQTPQPEP